MKTTLKRLIQAIVYLSLGTLFIYTDAIGSITATQTCSSGKRLIQGTGECSLNGTQDLSAIVHIQKAVCAEGLRILQGTNECLISGTEDNSTVTYSPNLKCPDGKRIEQGTGQCTLDGFKDSDGDGVIDIEDAFPNDPTEQIDTDGDGIGNNADTDDDGDGYSDAEENSAGTDPLDANSKPTAVVDNDILSSENTNLVGTVPANYVSGTSEDQKAYLFDGENVTSNLNLGSSSKLTISMDIYINDLKEAKTVLFDSGSANGNIKLSLLDNRASTFKDKDVALAFEVIGNSSTTVESKYRRFMEHELEYLQSEDHERRVNQLWMHLAVTYDSLQNRVDFYINGIHDSTQYFTSSNQALVDAISIGSDLSTNHKFYGKMGNLVVEKRVVPAEEIYARADFRKDLWAEKYESSWTATNYFYVDATNGDDNNDASESSPLKTLTAAINKLENLSNLDAVGTHIVVKPGLYREGNMKLTKNGSIYKPIVIEAETAGTAIISGSEILDDDAWSETSSGSGIWSHVWTDDFGRHAFHLPSDVDLDTEVRYHRELLAVDGDLARPYPNLDRLTNSTLHADASSFLSDDHGFYVDEPNDLIYLRSTKNPNSSVVEVGKREGLLDVTSNYVVLKGLTFKHDASFGNTYSSISGEAVMIKGKHILVEDCNAIDNGSDGMEFTVGSDLVVRRGNFSNNGRAGIITQRGYANAYLKGINVSYNQWRNDLGHYTGPDLSGYAKVMFSSRIYLEDTTISHHKNHGIWFDAQNMDITLDNCYFTQNNGALWFEINALNLGLINSSLYDNNVVGVRVDSESVYLKNNVMSQSNIHGAWGIISTLYYDSRDEQDTPTLYLGKWLTLEDNTIAVKSGSGKLMRFDDSALVGSTATSLNNAFYAPTTSHRIYSDNLTFSQWQAYFNDTTSLFAATYPFTNDGTATIGFEKSSLSVEESQTMVQIPIVLSKALDANVTLTLSVSGASATVDDDFTVLSGNTITFRPLERKKVINVLINRDFVDEGAEIFSLMLSNASNATLTAKDSVTVTINASNELLTVTQSTYNAYNRIEAENYDDNYEVNTIDNVGFGRFRKNHWAMYQNVDFGTVSPASVELSIAVPNDRAGRNFELRLDSPTGQTIATLTTIATDSDTTSDERSWDVFKTVSANLSQSVTGKHDVYIINTADYTNACVVDWFVFTK